MTGLLYLEKSLNKDECTDFIKEMATSQEIAASVHWKCKHMSYLIVKNELPGSGIVTTLSCDLSSISWKNLFNKTDLDCLTLQAILSLRGSFTIEDIKQYLKKIDNGSNEVLNFAIDNCTPSLKSTDLSDLCKHALKFHRVDFIDMMITSREVELDSAIILQTFDYYYHDKSNNIKILKLAMNKCTPPLASADLNVLCENAVKHKRFELVTEMISLGATLDAAVIVKECSVSVIANNPLCLEIMFEKCAPSLNNEELNKLCEKAANYKIFDLVTKLISRGATLDATTLVKGYRITEMSNDIIKVAMEKCTPSLSGESLNELCQNAAKCKIINLVKELMSFGATLDATVLMKSFSIYELSRHNYSDILDVATKKCTPPLDKESLDKLCKNAAECREVGLVEEIISRGANLDATIIVKKFNIHEMSHNFNIISIAMEKCTPPLSTDSLNELCKNAVNSKEFHLASELISRGASLDAAIIVEKFSVHNHISTNLKILDMAMEKCIPPLSKDDLNKLCETAVNSKQFQLVSELISRGAISDAATMVKNFGVNQISHNFKILDVAMEKCIPPLSDSDLNDLCEEAAQCKLLFLVSELTSRGAKLDAAILVKAFDACEILKNLDVFLEVAIERCTPPLNYSDLNKLCEDAARQKKIAMVMKLISRGAKLDATIIVKAFNVHEMSCNDNILKVAAERCVPPLSSSDLNKLCEEAARCNIYDMVTRLIAQGAVLDPTVIARKMTKEDLSNQQIISLLKSTPGGYIQLFLKATENFEFKKAYNFLRKEDIACISLSSILITRKLLNVEWKSYVSFLTKVLEYGINPDGIAGDEECPLDMVLKLTREQQTEKIELLTLLLKYNAAIRNCTYPRREGTTFLHIATKLALESGESALELLQLTCRSFPYDLYPEGKIQDIKNGDNPFHLVMERKYSPNMMRICEILSEGHFNPSFANKRGKKPGDGREKDKRYLILKEAAQRYHDTTKKKGDKKKKTKSKKAATSPLSNPPVENQSTSSPNVVPAKSAKPSSEAPLDSEEAFHEVKKMISELSSKPSSYFEPSYKRQNSAPHVQKVASEEQKPKDSGRSHVISTEDNASEIPTFDDKEDIDIHHIDKSFEDCTWEIECTDKVKKFFTNTKIPQKEKEKVVTKIRTIADGIPLNNHKLCKPLKNSASLYETRFSQGSRIIWEIAVQFSPRLSQIQHKYMYSEVIRLWDVVRDHDNLNQSIDHAVKCINRSQDQGKKASFKPPLTTQSPKQCTKDKKRFPQYYICNGSHNLHEEADIPCFLPAGSTRDGEYNVTTFYSFDSSFVKSMLSGDNARRDFPFKEWPDEHDIINMKQGEVSILLLGRSGTGKTTCCLYRLWNQFQNYWLLATISGPLIPKKTLAILQDKEDVISDDIEEVQEGICIDSEGSVSPPEEGEVSIEDVENVEVPVLDENITMSASHEVQPKETIYDDDLEHYHQIFITKNYVLCAQMKKRFYDLAAGEDVTEEHMPYEYTDIPTCLSQINDKAYPLFLTARQFFILLDNSFSDDKNFFPRDEDGKLMEKLLSSDYDHEDPDTLLDLEESDSEDDQDQDLDDEDFVHQEIPTKKKITRERREITASYFAEKIWPRISKGSTHLQRAKIDPLLVWMEIKSFIKGSMAAVENEKGFLSLEEYEHLGRKMAPNYADKRQEIYKIFELYVDYVKHHCDDNVFDECDLNHNIYTRLNAMKDLPWSIHSIYIDEVQDFTQAELSILIRICRDPNDLFLTGDTAQSIMRGISFRFSDLRYIFHRARKQVSKAIKSAPVKVPKVNQLTINFRSHTGVLKLAASMIDLLKELFPNSFDCLPGDEGMFSGPIPIVLDSCNVSDLALVMRTNKRESSTIEFGAHQVIIVQSEESKRNLPDVLKAGIVLTVFESKGLEFDDVLLYDFFKDSKVDKDWRVVTAFIEDYPNLIVNKESTLGKKPRRLDFDETQHKSLNGDLKYLYTAITRAKCNLWIYDSDEDKRLPVFDYWCKRGLVKVICVDDVTKDDQSILFSATSSKEEWKLQGDYFKKKRLWEPAMKCYQKAECPHFESEARAYSLAQQVRQANLKPNEKNDLYIQAAHAFLDCNKNQYDYQCLENAAKCLKNARKFRESSGLYALLGQDVKALKGYRRTKDAKVLAVLNDKKGDYDAAIRVLLKYNHTADALDYAYKYESQNTPISECYHVKHIAHQCAQDLHKSGKLNNDPTSMELFEKALGYFSNVEQVSYFKAAGWHEKACKILMEEGRYDQVYRVCRAQGWFSEGMELAKAQKDKQEELTFGLLTASKELSETEEDGKLTAASIAFLKKKMGFSSETEVLGSLFYGMALRNDRVIKDALNYYVINNNLIAHVETFSIAVANIEYDETSQRWKNIYLGRHDDLFMLTLQACKAIRTISSGLTCDQSTQQQDIIRQVESFYGLERVTSKEVYCVPNFSYPWTNRLLKQLPQEAGRDEDGMLLFEMSTMYVAIRNHLDEFIRKWIVDDELRLVETFCKSGFINFPFHQSVISDGGHLVESYLMHPDQIIHLKYLNRLSLAYDFICYGSKRINSEIDVIRATLNALSPQVTSYVKVSTLFISSEQLSEELKREASDVLAKYDHQFDFNKWFEAWLINCVTRRGHSQMKNVLITKSIEYDEKGRQTIGQFQRQWSNEITNLPVYVNNKNSYQHLMLVWITSCELMQDGKILPSCTVAVHNVIRHIGSHKSIWNTVSVSNLVNIVTVHTVAILSMHAAILVLLQQPAGKIYLPSSYKNVTDIFCNLNAIKGKNKSLSDLCIQFATRRPLNQLQSAKEKLLNLLTIMLRVMIGLHNRSFNPLKYALTAERSLQNHEAEHCLILVLIIFGNMGLMNCPDETLQIYRHCIFESIGHCAIPEIQGAAQRFATSATMVGSFGAAKSLLTPSHDNLDCLNFFYNAKFHTVEISTKPAQLMTIFQRRLLPIVTSAPRQLQPATITESRLRPDAPEFFPSNILTESGGAANLMINTEAAEAGTAIADDDFDEEASELLKIPQKQLSVNEQNVFPDNPMIVKDLCRICVRGLKSEVPDVSDDGMNPNPQGLETYSEHLRSELHLQNVENYKIFEDEEKDYYKPRVDDLTALHSKCEKICEDKSFLADLKPVIEDIDRELKQNDKQVQRIRDSAEWVDGTKMLQDMGGRLEALQRRVKSEIEKTERKKKDIEKTKQEQERREREEEEMEEDQINEEYREEDIAGAELDYGEQDKKKRRKRKRNKK